MNDDRSLEELRRESEVTRAALTNTVHELRDKIGQTAGEVKDLLSPANVTEEVKGYVRDKREHLYANVERKVRDNPLQAAAVGAAIAYPLFSIARRMPIPLMLIGAGLFLTRQKTAAGSEHLTSGAGGTASSHLHIPDAPSIVSERARQSQRRARQS
jgi:ElaB/YqjD/DUF883 family membrane-anchored ribosome-binding protein